MKMNRLALGSSSSIRAHIVSPMGRYSDWVFPEGGSGGAQDIVGEGGHAGVRLPQLLDAGGVLRQHAGGALLSQRDPPGELFRHALVAEHEVEKPAEDGEDQNGNDPRQLVGGVFILADQPDRDRDAQRGEESVDGHKVVAQQDDRHQQDRQLDQHQQDDDGQLAEKQAEYGFCMHLLFFLCHKHPSLTSVLRARGDRGWPSGYRWQYCRQ